MMKRPAKWKIATFIVVLGGLHLLGVAFAMVKPHVSGAGVNAAVSLSALPAVVARSCFDAGDPAAQAQTRTGLRGLRAAPSRRDGASRHVFESVAHTAQGREPVGPKLAS